MPEEDVHRYGHWCERRDEGRRPRYDRVNGSQVKDDRRNNPNREGGHIGQQPKRIIKEYYSRGITKMQKFAFTRAKQSVQCSGKCDRVVSESRVARSGERAGRPDPTEVD